MNSEVCAYAFLVTAFSMRPGSAWNLVHRHGAADISTFNDSGGFLETVKAEWRRRREDCLISIAAGRDCARVTLRPARRSGGSATAAQSDDQIPGGSRAAGSDEVVQAPEERRQEAGGSNEDTGGGRREE